MAMGPVLPVMVPTFEHSMEPYKLSVPACQAFVSPLKRLSWGVHNDITSPVCSGHSLYLCLPMSICEVIKRNILYSLFYGYAVLVQVMETERHLYLVTEYASKGEIFGKCCSCHFSASPSVYYYSPCAHCHENLYITQACLHTCLHCKRARVLLTRGRAAASGL